MRTRIKEEKWKKEQKIWICYLFYTRSSFIIALIYGFKMLLYENALLIHLLITTHRQSCSEMRSARTSQASRSCDRWVSWTPAHCRGKYHRFLLFVLSVYIIYIICVHVHVHKQNRRDSRIPGAKWITLVFIKTFNNWGFVAIKFLLALSNRHDIYLPLWQPQCLMT